MQTVDVIVFILFFAVVVSVSLYKSRREKNSEDYFLAGRGLTWPRPASRNFTRRVGAQRKPAVAEQARMTNPTPSPPSAATGPSRVRRNGEDGSLARPGTVAPEHAVSPRRSVLCIGLEDLVLRIEGVFQRVVRVGLKPGMSGIVRQKQDRLADLLKKPFLPGGLPSAGSRAGAACLAGGGLEFIELAARRGRPSDGGHQRLFSSSPDPSRSGASANRPARASSRPPRTASRAFASL